MEMHDLRVEVYTPAGDKASQSAGAINITINFN